LYHVPQTISKTAISNCSYKTNIPTYEFPHPPLIWP